MDRLKKEEGLTLLDKSFGLNETAIIAIKQKEDAITISIVSGTKLSAKQSSYTRAPVKGKLEKKIPRVIWTENNTQKRLPVDGNTIKPEVLRTYKQIKEL